MKNNLVERVGNRRKYWGIIIFILVILAIVMCCACASYVDRRNKRYTNKMNNYSIFIPMPENSYYTEFVGDFKIQIWSLFDLTLNRQSKASVEISLDNVYWKERDDYITIGLRVQEDLDGDFEYFISYESCLPMDERSFIEDGDIVYNYVKKEYVQKGKFVVDKNFHLLSNHRNQDSSGTYEDFLSQNGDAIKGIVERANFYWDLDMALEF